MPTLTDQYDYNVARGPLYEDATSLPENSPEAHIVKYLAYYLPQYHTIAENDRAWGVGFTEWTNATKALPRYVGHYQPRLPGDLGFYDLSNVDTIRKQVDLARRGGVYGFCIHFYWFSGREIMSGPLNAILSDPTIEIPFCINWANESWSKRWDGSESEIIVKQSYDPEDKVSFAKRLLQIVGDRRYIRINGRPLVMLYRPDIIPDIKSVVATWREVFKGEGVEDPYVVMPQVFGNIDPSHFGMDAAAGFAPHRLNEGLPGERHKLKLLDPYFLGHVTDYDGLIARAEKDVKQNFPYFPGVCPNWDNEARRPHRGYGFYGSTPHKYGQWLKVASRQALDAPTQDERIVFINAWNEWAEGTYLEPDRHFGFAYLAETRRTLDSIRGSRHEQRSNGVEHRVDGTGTFQARPSSWNYLRTIWYALIRRYRLRSAASR